MSQRKIPLEQPPYVEGQDPAVREWLSRMMIMMNAAFDQVDDLEPTGIAPDKPSNGMFRYFAVSIPTAGISSPGPWMFVEGIWTKMV